MYGAFRVPECPHRLPLPGTSGHTHSVLRPHGKSVLESHLSALSMQRFVPPSLFPAHMCITLNHSYSLLRKGGRYVLNTFLEKKKKRGFNFCVRRQPQPLFWAQQRSSFKHRCQNWTTSLISEFSGGISWVSIPNRLVSKGPVLKYLVFSLFQAVTLSL